MYRISIIFLFFMMEEAIMPGINDPSIRMIASNKSKKIAGQEPG
jgi:hypothetical protein